MYTSVKHFLERLEKSGDSIHLTIEDTRMAVAVLYYRVVMVDGRIRQEETKHFRDLVCRTLEVTEDELMSFEQEVLRLARQDSNLFPLTNVIRKLSRPQREAILENMKALSISDREYHEFEINLVARAAELLGLGGDEGGRSN